MAKIGQRDGLSETDTEKVNYVYSSECLERNRQYLLNTCPTVTNNNPKAEPTKVQKQEIDDYFKERLWPFGIIHYKFRDNMEFCEYYLIISVHILC